MNDLTILSAVHPLDAATVILKCDLIADAYVAMQELPYNSTDAYLEGHHVGQLKAFVELMNMLTGSNVDWYSFVDAAWARKADLES